MHLCASRGLWKRSVSPGVGSPAPECVSDDSVCQSGRVRIRAFRDQNSSAQRLPPSSRSGRQGRETPTDIPVTSAPLPGGVRTRFHAAATLCSHSEGGRTKPAGPASIWVITRDPPKVPLGFSIRYGVLLPKRCNLSPATLLNRYCIPPQRHRLPFNDERKIAPLSLQTLGIPEAE